MKLCTDCLHADDRKVEHCPSCGGTAFASVTSNGDLVTVPAEAGMPCQGCLQTERELKLRYYRRVAGMLILDRIWADCGYYCGACRRRMFAKNIGFTLLLGWWGLIAFFFRNPYAIFVNLWALVGPPIGAGEFGAMNADEIRAESARDAQREQRLSDVYMRMPGWMESLSEEDFKRVLVNTDFYAVLGVEPSASHSQIRNAWRTQAKTNHPDHAGAAGLETMIAVNEAWDVLGDERLRHAYDHREELLAFLDEAEAANADYEPEADFVMVVGCRECRLGFESFDDAADHVDAVHPNTDYVDILVSLADESDNEPADHEQAPPAWRCRSCAQTFTDYHEALDHLDAAHPERTVVDPRSALEPA
jgi:hypothetical protein